MKDYPLATFLSLIAGWFAGMLVHNLLSLYWHTSLEAGDTVALAVWSGICLLIAYGLFIQLPHRYIKKACLHLSLLSFAALMLGYGLLSFTLLIGWMFLLDWNFLIVFADAAAIGFVFGCVFWHLWHRQKTDHSPFDL